MKFNMPFTSSEETKYEPVKEAFLPISTDPRELESSSDPIYKPKESSPLHTRMSVIFGKTIIVILAFIGLTNLTIHAKSKLLPTKLPSCNCGETPQESLAMGCKFDTLSHAWLQPYCIDDELTAEFDHSGPGPNGEWQFYLDRNGSMPISTEEKSMLPNDVPVYAAFAWHLNHCFFYWRKTYRSKFLGTVLEGKYDNEFHIKHCTMQAQQRTDLSEISSTAFVYLDPDHSVHEMHWPQEIRDMYLVEHNLKNPHAEIDGSAENYGSNY